MKPRERVDPFRWQATVNRVKQVSFCCWPGLLLCLVGTLRVSAADATDGPVGESLRPNIVLILADDMGLGDPGCYNQNSGCLTPAIDALAAQGMKFTDAHAAGSLCHPSRFGLLTGRHPAHYDMDWRVKPLISEEMETVPRLLGRAGYQTQMIGKWHLGFENGPDYDFANLRGGPQDRGFQEYFGIPASTDIPPYYYIRNRRTVTPPTLPIAANQSPGWSPIQGAFWREGLIASDLKLPDVLDRFADEATSAVAKLANREAPYFLYVALAAPHTPWLPAERFREIGRTSLYGEFVAHVDEVVGRVVAAVDQTDTARETMIIFSSDNGPVWYPADVERFQHSATGPFRGMKGDAWEGGHRVPWIVRWPAQMAAGTENSALIGFIDLLPTLAEMTGTAIENSTAVEGMSFAGELLPDRPGWSSIPENRCLVLHHSGAAVRCGPWKLINQLGSLGFSQPARRRPVPGEPPGQLYDLAADPGETVNLWDREPDQVRRMQGVLQRFQELGEGQ